MNTSVDISSIKTTFDGLEYDIRLVKSDFLLPTSGPQCSISTFTLIKLCNVFVGLQCRWLRVLFQLSYIKYALCLIHWINQTKSWTHRRTRVFVSCAPCPQESPEILMLHSNNSDSIATYPGTSTWPLLSHRVWDPGYSLLMQSKKQHLLRLHSLWPFHLQLYYHRYSTVRLSGVGLQIYGPCRSHLKHRQQRVSSPERICCTAHVLLVSPVNYLPAVEALSYLELMSSLLALMACKFRD